MKIAVDEQNYRNSNNISHNMDKHLLKAIKGEGFALSGTREGECNDVK